MKSLYLKSGKIEDVFNELRNTLDGTLVSDNGEHILTVGSDFAKGSINGISFPEGISYLQFDIVFRDDVIVSMESLNNSPIFFAYCSEGSLQHSVGLQGNKKSLKKSQTGILKTAAKINSILYFEKNIPLKFSILGIRTNKIGNNIPNVLITKLKNTFFSTKEDLMHIRFQNLKITQKIEEFNSIKQKGIVGNKIKNEILNNIVAMEIEQHNDSFSIIFDAVNGLALRQIDEIKKVYNFITNFPVEGFIFKFLPQKTALPSDKLQGGFKWVHNQNV